MDWWNNNVEPRPDHKGNASQGQDFAQLSFGDAMSALLFAFILIALVYMMMSQLQSQLARDQQEIARSRQEEIERLRQQIDTQLNQQRIIIGQLTEQLRANDIDVVPDPVTGDLSIRENLLFDVGQAQLKPEGRDFIRNLIATYVDVIYAADAPPEFRETVVRIVVEGYTSSEGESLANMDLGARRATSVYDFAISDPQLAEVRGSSGWADFENALLVSSRGELDASDEVRAEDRRVLFRFQFRTVESVIRLLEEAGFGGTEGSADEQAVP
jgi:outer membrane protein OmpA-like peptidoglycan-associated protein